MKALLDTFVASDLPPIAKGFFVAVGALFVAVGFGAVLAAIAHAVRALPLERKR